MSEAEAAQVALLEHLINVAQKTEGAGVWRALFAEIRERIVAEAAKHK
jgi:hypothetical protein